MGNTLWQLRTTPTSTTVQHTVRLGLRAALQLPDGKRWQSAVQDNMQWQVGPLYWRFIVRTTVIHGLPVVPLQIIIGALLSVPMVNMYKLQHTVATFFTVTTTVTITPRAPQYQYNGAVLAWMLLVSTQLRWLMPVTYTIAATTVQLGPRAMPPQQRGL